MNTIKRVWFKVGGTLLRLDDIVAVQPGTGAFVVIDMRNHSQIVIQGVTVDDVTRAMIKAAGMEKKE